MINFLKKYFQDKENLELLSKGSSFLVIKIIGTLFSFMFTLYMTNTFGEAVWGLFSLAVIIFSLLSVVGCLGLDTNLVKFYSQDTHLEDVGIYFKSLVKVILFTSLITLVFYYFSPFIVNEVFIVPKPELISYFKWILPSIPFWSIVLLSSSVMRARKMNKLYAFYMTAARFICLVAFIQFFNTTQVDFILQLYFYTILGLSIVSIIHTIIILKKISFKSNENSWLFVKDSLPMMLSSSLLILMSWTDTFVLGVYQDESEVGIYNVAVKITTLSIFSLQAINSILAPKIAKLYSEGNKESYHKLIQFSTKINFFITCVVITFILVFSTFFLDLFGDGFISGFNILLILCVGQLINSLSGSVGIVLQMIGEQKRFQNYILTALFVNLVLTIVLTQLYSGVGAAIATVVSIIFWNIPGAYYLKKKKGIQTYFYPFK